MKKFITNNLKIITTIIISGSLFTGIGVYAATQYLAKDISFSPKDESWKVTNVDAALNELYKNSNKSVYIYLRAESFSSSNQSSGLFAFGDLMNHYKKFKIVNVTTSSYTKFCNLYAWSLNKNEAVVIEPNIEYLINSDEDGLKFNSIFNYTQSTVNGQYANCETAVLLYN